MILILGAKGQVGAALTQALGNNCIPLDRAETDLSRPESLPGALERFHPTALINAAAYTAVDKAEEERAAAFAVNAHAPGVLAKWAADRRIPFIHYSTDYVFNGVGSTAWTEEDETQPLNVYGASKEAGEEAVITAGGRYLIFRTSWVYNETGHNFLNTMLRLGREREELRVVADQHGAPTYAGHLAEATLRALEAAVAAERFPSGLYHLCNAGETSWYGFAETIFSRAKAEGMPLAVQRVLPIASSEYPTPAARPHNSRLSCHKARRVLRLEMPAWQEGLKTCMTRKYANPHHAAG